MQQSNLIRTVCHDAIWIVENTLIMQHAWPELHQGALYKCQVLSDAVKSLWADDTRDNGRRQEKLYRTLKTWILRDGKFVRYIGKWVHDLIYFSFETSWWCIQYRLSIVYLVTVSRCEVLPLTTLPFFSLVLVICVLNMSRHWLRMTCTSIPEIGQLIRMERYLHIILLEACSHPFPWACLNGKEFSHPHSDLPQPKSYWPYQDCILQWPNSFQIQVQEALCHIAPRLQRTRINHPYSCPWCNSSKQCFWS